MTDRCFVAVTLFATTLACTGRINGSQNAGGTEDSPSSEPQGGEGGTGQASPPDVEAPLPSAEDLPDAVSCKPDLGLTPLRRLTRDEYVATVSGFLPGLTLPELALPNDRRAGSFLAQTDPLASDALERYADAAEAIGSSSGAAPKVVFGACDFATREAACLTELFDRAGRTLYRGPLAAAERKGLLDRFFTPLRTPGLAPALSRLISRLLVSPRFLYHLETGVAEPTYGAGVTKLDGRSVAARLSYLLTSAPPDAELLAMSDALATNPTERARQARRLLATPRGVALVTAFFSQWLELGRLDNAAKDSKLYPEWNDSLKASMREETRRFVEATLRTDNGSLDSFFLSRRTFAGRSLAKLYGVTTANDAFASVELPSASERPGLLGQAAFLAGHAGPNVGSIVQRGLAVRHQLLCLEVPDPPQNVKLDAAVDRLATPLCAGCHKLFDPIGEVFSGYDAVGKFNAAKPTAGALPDTGESSLDGAVSSPRPMMERIVASQTFRACASQRFLELASARDVGEVDACTISKMVAALQGSGNRLPDMIAAFVQSPVFVLRRELPADVSKGTCP